MVLIHKSCLQYDVQWKNDFCQSFSADSPEALSLQGLHILWRKMFAADATMDQLLGPLSNFSYLYCSRSFATSPTCLTLRSSTRVQAPHVASTALPGGMTKSVRVTSPHFAPGIPQRTCMSRCNATLLTVMLLNETSACQH